MSNYEEYPGVEFRKTDVEGLEVGSNGIVTFINGKTHKREFSSGSNDRGYRRIALRTDGITVVRLIHRLVAAAFIPNPGGYELVLHKNDIKNENDMSNLYWGNKQMNFEDMKRNGIKPNSGRRVLSVEDAANIREQVAEGISRYKVAEEYNVSRRLVQKIVNKEVWV